MPAPTASPAYVIGLDYGTDSARALLVDARTGAEVAQAVHYYPRWQQGQYCHPAQNRFRQHPLDYLESLEATVREVAAKVPAAQILGLAIDTTGSTPGPVNAAGVALGLLPEFAENPNALFVLWKDHTVLAEAAGINHKARTWGGEDYTKYTGGIYSSEWFWAKIMHITRQDEAVAQAAYSWLEHCDWLTFTLTGPPLAECKRRRRAAGHKVEAETKFGYEVNTYGIGDLVAEVNAVTDEQLAGLVATYEQEYELADILKAGGEQRESLRDAARIELGLRKFLTDRHAKGFTDTFEDLHGLKQLPGIATQRLMADGYGFGGEGDWKTAALVRALNVMGAGLPGGSSFREDYTCHFAPGNEQVLGSHLLESCPSIAAGQVRAEAHPLGIGGKEDPVRLVFSCPAGPALNATIVALGNRFRLLVNTVEAVAPAQDLPKLPVARVLWKVHPDLKTGLAAWILAGGAHHTGYSQNLTSEYLEDFAEMAGIEFLIIDEDTKLRTFKNELRYNEGAFKS